MAPSVDPAIVQALGLDPGTTKLASHGGSGFSSTFKLTTIVNDKEENFFVKTSHGKDAEVMFKGEISLGYFLLLPPSILDDLSHVTLNTAI